MEQNVMPDQNENMHSRASKATVYICRWKVKSICWHTKHSRESNSCSSCCNSSNRSVTSSSSATFLLPATVVIAARWLAVVAHRRKTYARVTSPVTWFAASCSVRIRRRWFVAFEFNHNSIIFSISLSPKHISFMRCIRLFDVDHPIILNACRNAKARYKPTRTILSVCRILCNTQRFPQATTSHHHSLQFLPPRR